MLHMSFQSVGSVGSPHPFVAEKWEQDEDDCLKRRASKRLRAYKKQARHTEARPDDNISTRFVIRYKVQLILNSGAFSVR